LKKTDDRTSGVIRFKTGMLTPGEIELIFNTLPVDITFVDKSDTVSIFPPEKKGSLPAPPPSSVGPCKTAIHRPASISWKNFYRILTIFS
jgi:hypothetical protein